MYVVVSRMAPMQCKVSAVRTVQDRQRRLGDGPLGKVERLHVGGWNRRAVHSNNLENLVSFLDGSAVLADQRDNSNPSDARR